MFGEAEAYFETAFSSQLFCAFVSGHSVSSSSPQSTPIVSLNKTLLGQLYYFSNNLVFSVAGQADNDNIFGITLGYNEVAPLARATVISNDVRRH
jgi:hypothetical protein